MLLGVNDDDKEKENLRSQTADTPTTAPSASFTPFKKMIDRFVLRAEMHCALPSPLPCVVFGRPVIRFLLLRMRKAQAGAFNTPIGHVFSVKHFYNAVRMDDQSVLALLH